MFFSPCRKGIPFWHPASLACTWFGCGLMPVAPGTWGSAAALPLAWGMAWWGGSLTVALASLLCALVGWWAASVYVRRTGVDDPCEIVIDEVAGQWLVLAAIPPEPMLYLAGFLVFRIMDITKPWPARWADRNIHGGLGVMLDDMLAAAYGAVVMTVIALWWSLP